jgi:MFS-type transporter involved in bile tolerance (Atg22 family)
MSHILNHFSLQAAKWNSWTVVSLFLIWAGVVGCVISSIVTQPFDRKQRIFWIAIVVLIPFLGVLSYLPFAFRKEDLPRIFMRKSRSSKRPKVHEPRPLP